MLLLKILNFIGKIFYKLFYKTTYEEEMFLELKFLVIGVFILVLIFIIIESINKM